MTGARAMGGRPPNRRRPWRIATALAGVVIVMGLSACTPTRWQNELASVNAAGTDSADAASWGPQLSPDGTKVVFESSASNLGPADTNGVEDVYVRDLASGVTSLVSVSAAGADSGDARSMIPWFSPDGTKVMFASYATNLTTPATDGEANLYVRDLATGTTTLISVDADGSGGGDGATTAGWFSPQGDKVVFTSEAHNLVPADPGALMGVYERDLTTGVTTRLSDGYGAVYSPSGDAVAFMNGRQPWLRDGTTGTVTSISAGLPGATGTGLLAFSPDGTKLAFERRTNTDLVRSDIYVYDLATRTADLVTVDVSGNGGSNNSPSRVYGFHPTDSNRLLFSSSASNLVNGDTNGPLHDVFVRDLAQGTTTLVSANGAGSGSGSGRSSKASWVGDGGKIAFVTHAANLGLTDTNSSADVYVRDLAAGTYSLASVDAAGDKAGNGASGEYTHPVGYVEQELSVSADGARIAFGSDASDLGARDSDRPGDHDVYVASLGTPAA